MRERKKTKFGNRWYTRRYLDYALFSINNLLISQISVLWWQRVLSSQREQFSVICSSTSSRICDILMIFHCWLQKSLIWRQQPWSSTCPVKFSLRFNSVESLIDRYNQFVMILLFIMKDVFQWFVMLRFFEISRPPSQPSPGSQFLFDETFYLWKIANKIPFQSVT